MIEDKISVERGGKFNQFSDNPTLLRIIESLAAHGLDDKEIASVLGVSLTRLKANLSAVPELEEALVKGRSRATQAVVAALFKTAVGGQVIQEVRETITKKGEKTTTVITRELPPNPTLLMFWLVNRDGANWRHIRQIISENKELEAADVVEADKIARLAGRLLEDDTGAGGGESSLPPEASHDIGGQ